MPKILVVYESKYGNTKRVAEAIVQGMQRVAGTELTLSEIKAANPKTIVSYDAVVIGGPNHMGGPTRGVKKFIDNLSKLSLEGKQFAVFDTYIREDFEKAARKMEQRVHDKAPAVKVMDPVLSIKVEGMKGPIVEGELPKAEEFGTKIASQLMTPA